MVALVKKQRPTKQFRSTTMKISRGFTLVEMAVVLIIIAFLVSGLLVPLSKQLEQKRIQATDECLEQINDALIGFAIISGRLPCPDTDSDGIEDTFCNTEGELPWATLAINTSHSIDGWGNPLRYRVDQSYTSQPLPDDPPDTSSSLRVRDRDGDELTDESVNSNVIAIIFSYGRDQQANGENNSTDNVYAKDVYIENQFDDRLVWLPKSILISRLALAGKWPPL